MYVGESCAAFSAFALFSYSPSRKEIGGAASAGLLLFVFLNVRGAVVAVADYGLVQPHNVPSFYEVVENSGCAVQRFWWVVQRVLGEIYLVLEPLRERARWWMPMDVRYVYRYDTFALEGMK